MQITTKLRRQVLITRLDRFDWTVLIAVMTLLTAIGGVVVHGDQVGIRVQGFGPSGSVSSRSSVHVVFGETLDATSAQSHFVIDPPVPGQLMVTGDQLTFRPQVPLLPGQT